MKKVMSSFEFIYKNGVRLFIKECYYRIMDKFFDKYFNVDTKGLISMEDLAISNHESSGYSSVWYIDIITMLNKIPMDRSKSTLLDYGCGKGRVIITAATYQYKKIFGVELSNLINIAKENIDKMKHRKTENISLIQCDAQNFCVSTDVNIIYFFNPFVGSILKNVISNIYASYKEAPRKIYIIYFRNKYFDEAIRHQDWLTKIYQTDFHMSRSCGLYETRL